MKAIKPELNPEEYISAIKFWFKVLEILDIVENQMEIGYIKALICAETKRYVDYKKNSPYSF